MERLVGNTSVVLIGQVTKAKSNHRVEKAPRLLKRTLSGNSEVVYLGNITSAIIAALESPDTPEFTQLPDIMTEMAIEDRQWSTDCHHNLRLIMGIWLVNLRLSQCH